MINIIIYKAESLTRYSENGAFALHLQQYWWQCVSSFMWFPRVCGFMQVLKGPAGKVIQLSHSKMEAFSESCADELEMNWQGAFWCNVEQM